MRRKVKSKGSITLVSITIIMAILAGFLMVTLHSINTNYAFQKRAFSYLCLKHFNFRTRKYIQRMGQLNRAIFLAHKARYIPGTSEEATISHALLKQTQNILHLVFIKKLLTYNRCSKIQRITLLKAIPYRSMVILQRHSNGTARLHRGKWKLTFPINIRERSFVIEEFILKDNYATKIIIQSKERVFMEVPYWNHFSGSLYSHFSSEWPLQLTNRIDLKT